MTAPIFENAALAATIGDDFVATIELRNPPNNFFSLDQIGGVADALEALDTHDACRAAVLCADGKHFCAGADFSSGGRSYTTDDLYAAAARIFRTRTPTATSIRYAAWSTRSCRPATTCCAARRSSTPISSSTI